MLTETQQNKIKQLSQQIGSAIGEDPASIEYMMHIALTHDKILHALEQLSKMSTELEEARKAQIEAEKIHLLKFSHPSRQKFKRKAK